MSFTKRLMEQGRWELRLREDAPEQIIDLVGFAGHIVVPGERIDVQAMSDDDVLNQAVYVGVVTRKPTPQVISFGGPALGWWLGATV